MDQGFYILVAFENQERYPMWKTTEGETAIPFFKSEASAKAFAESSKDEDWVPRVLNREELARWIEGAVAKYGLAEIAVDPRPEDVDSAQVIPASMLLAILELSGQ